MNRCSANNATRAPHADYASTRTCSDWLAMRSWEDDGGAPQRVDETTIESRKEQT